jgi:hypothetical protein
MDYFVGAEACVDAGSGCGACVGVDGGAGCGACVGVDGGPAYGGAGVGAGVDFKIAIISI